MAPRTPTDCAGTATNPERGARTEREIDDEIRRIVEAAHANAKRILTDNRQSLDRLAHILLERETIDRRELEMLLARYIAARLDGATGTAQLQC